MKNEYFVSVGNIGNITVSNFSEAKKTYNEYVKQSKQNYGRAAGEAVIIFKNNEPMLQYEYYGILEIDFD